jgi:hypothetical protein
MSTEAEELHRIISTSVRDMLDAFRIQAQAGPVTDNVLEEIVFRAAHGVVQSLAPYPGPQRVAMLPSVVRVKLTTFLEGLVRSDRRLGSPMPVTSVVPPARSAQRWNTPLTVPLHGRVTSGVSKVARRLLDSRAAGEEDSAST